MKGVVMVRNEDCSLETKTEDSVNSGGTKSQVGSEERRLYFHSCQMMWSTMDIPTCINLTVYFITYYRSDLESAFLFLSFRLILSVC